MGLDLAAFKTSYAADPVKATEEFWADYNMEEWSLWKMTYDYADDNEELDPTIEIVQSFMKGSESIKEECFGVMHVLGKLEIEGTWLFKGESPENLFGCNEDTSYFTWEAIGPADTVKDKVTKAWTATTELDGKAIQHKEVSS